MAKVSHKEALGFLKKVGMTGGETLLQGDKLAFLTSLTGAFHEHMPFQTVSMVATEKEDQHVPSLEEIVAAGLSMESGVCFTLNTFMCLLLRALGLDAHVLDASYSGFGDTHDHVIVLVKDLRWASDSYLVEVGCGFPCPEPVPLATLPVFQRHAGLEYCYRREGDMVLRLHREGDTHPLNGEKPVMKDGWRQIFHFSLTPVDFHFFVPYMHHIYHSSATCDFNTVIRAVRFPPLESMPALTPKPGTKSQNRKPTSQGSTNNEGQKIEDKWVMVAAKNETMLLGTMGAYEKTTASSEDLAAIIKQLFPNIPPWKVDLAAKKVLAQTQQQQQKLNPQLKA